MDPFRKLLELSALAESVKEAGYRAKIDAESEWIMSAAGGYKVVVVPMADAIKLRVIFDYSEHLSWDLVNKFNVENRIAKALVLGDEGSERTFIIDVDALVPIDGFDSFLYRVFVSLESALSSFDRMMRQTLKDGRQTEE